MVDIQLNGFAYHESRSHRAPDEEPALTESTPLINRFPETSVPPRRNLLTLVTVGVLLVVLVVGVIIGIRLLILETDSENVLPPEPPEEMALKIITRQRWDNGSAPLGSSPYAADVLEAVQTDTRPCTNEDSCTTLLREMKASSGQDLPHNFLLSSNGQAYEAMGWHTSHLFHNALVLAFIGNFTESPPSAEQIKAAKDFVDFAQSQRRLKPKFTIVGKNTKYAPKYLYQSLMTYPQWSDELSDS